MSTQREREKRAASSRAFYHAKSVDVDLILRPGPSPPPAQRKLANTWQFQASSPSHALVHSVDHRRQSRLERRFLFRSRGCAWGSARAKGGSSSRKTGPVRNNHGCRFERRSLASTRCGCRSNNVACTKRTAFAV